VWRAARRCQIVIETVAEHEFAVRRQNGGGLVAHPERLHRAGVHIPHVHRDQAVTLPLRQGAAKALRDAHTSFARHRAADGERRKRLDHLAEAHVRRGLRQEPTSARLTRSRLEGEAFQPVDHRQESGVGLMKNCLEILIPGSRFTGLVAQLPPGSRCQAKPRVGHAETNSRADERPSPFQSAGPYFRMARL
jgi:hypothetical protein